MSAPSRTDDTAVGDTAGEVAADASAADIAHELVRVLQGVLTGVQGVVGAGASQALLRYGAFEEGRRLATQAAEPGLEGATAHVDRLFGQTSHAERQAGGEVRVELYASPLVAADNALLDTILLGLYEGLLNGTFQARFRGTIKSRKEGDAALLFAATSA